VRASNKPVPAPSNRAIREYFAFGLQVRSDSPTSSWTRGTRTYSLTVTTNPPLHYTATCTTFPRFDAGTLTAAITRNGQTMNVVIQFTACGQYTVTRS
jgi:hypothetical protein